MSVQGTARFARDFGLTDSNPLTRTGRHVYRTTGLYRDEIIDLCARIHEATIETGSVWPPKFGLYKSVLVTLIYLRHNRIQEELGETYETSQSTISRAITGLTPLLAELLRGHVPTAEELDLARQ